MKFGGSSLSTALRILKAARIVARFGAQHQVAVVVSALDEITDQLALIGEEASKGNLKRVRVLSSRIAEAHRKASTGIPASRTDREELRTVVDNLLEELKRTWEGIAQLRELTPRSRDYLLSFGERLSAPIMMTALHAIGLEANSLTGANAGITTDDGFGEARPLLEVSFHQIRQKLGPLLSRRIVPVIAGFIAETVNGTITTLGRGGSDYTATIIGAALRVDEVWIWTDVDGLMTADPRVVRDARVIPEVSFGESLELSYFGAKMMHPKALQPAAREKIPVRIKNTFEPDAKGTLVSANETAYRGRVVKAVAMIPDVGMVTIGGSGMMGAPGIAAKVFQTLGSSMVNVMMISQGSSEAAISCVVAKKDLDRGVRALQLALMGQGFVDEVSVERDACIIAVVGSGMKGTPGIAARIFRAVAAKQVNVRMVAQGSSEYNVSFVVSRKDGPKATIAIHTEFSLGEPA